MRTATARTRTGALADAAEEHACLLLAVLAARHFADQPEWALLLADLLDVEERLYPDPEPVAVTVVPGAHATARDIVDLVVALADRYDQAATHPAETVQRSLTLAGCAARARQATKRLRAS